MDRSMKFSILLLFLAIAAVVGGVLHRQAPVTAAPPSAGQGWKVIDSGLLQAATLHRSLLADAARVPAEVQAGLAQLPPRPPIPEAQSAPPAAEAPQAMAPELPEVPPSRQVQIGFSGGVIGETDPCG